ncbi:nucleotidyltransferase domain-containing protein [Kribbella sp. NPDC023855]|uniref:nucleotidyltransferase domain-containing protein n=1 Tax=Kribbella sp. NPDC023855 TaxID=3154698 RepID=UPI003411745B
MLDEAVDLARQLVKERYPQARAAWLGGSVVRGTATKTSDLDITVLLPGPPAPLRESLQYGAWPVELFVHTEASLTRYCEKDRQRRQPSLMRLIGETIILLDTDGSGAQWQESGKAQLQAGPPPLTDTELQLLRYKITDLVEDLIGADSNDVRTAVASILWQEAATLLLTGSRHWTGTGKGLLRELTAYDAERATDYATALPAAMRAAANGNPEALTATVDAILDPHGGRLFAGFHLSGN